MATMLEKLMFSISLLDKISGPAGKIKKTVSGMAEGISGSFQKITAGAAGMGAAGYTLHSLAAPANEFNMAIGQVRSLEVAQNSLDALSDKAIAFSVKYGESAADIVASSYDIQSAIAGLAGDELAVFTNASGVLAKGTKSDAATITNYMGTMYGIFQKSADNMGKAKWVEQLTGQTATAVKMFKTTGSEMAGAFSSLGASATASGVDQAEQIAVLGQLQATMSGSEAGTKYTAFLSGVGKAQEKLGLKFTDSSGKMLGMVDILTKLKGKFGDSLSVAESDLLKNAFGSEEAVKLINLLLPQTQALAGNITDIGNVKGMDKAIAMAETMIDPFQQWSQGVQAVRIGLGQALMPVLTPALAAMTKGAGTIYRWTQEFPGLTKWIGYGVVLVAWLTGAVAAFAIMGGIASMATIGFGNATGVLSFVMGGLRNVLIATKFVIWAVNAAMFANPIGLIIGGVVLLTASVAAAIYYWDDLKKAFLDSSWGQAIMGWIDKIMGGFRSLTGVWDTIKDKISWLPGMKGEMSSDMPLTSASLEAPRKSAALPGGVSKVVANAVTNNSRSDSRSVHVGQVVTSRPINSQEISSMMWMGA